MNKIWQKSLLISFASFLSSLISDSSKVVYGFDPSPSFQQIETYTTSIDTVGSMPGFDETDIYFPVTSNVDTEFPLVVLLQGALVDKADYVNYASLVAGYGFVVAIPNHERTLSNGIITVTDFFPDVELINDVLDFMETENQNNLSPAQGIVNTDSLGLIGHSFGGATGLSAIDGNCYPVLCNGSYVLPSQLQAGIFYGANFRDQITGEFLPIDNQNIATGLIAGNLDGVASLSRSEITYDNISNPPKILVTVDGANHYGITNEDSFRDPVRPTLAQDIATETIARWSGLFLRSHLWDDKEAFDYIYLSGDSLDENVTVISETVPEPNFSRALLSLGIFLFLIKSRQKHLIKKL